MPGMTSAPRKGRRDFEPASCLNETGVDCTKVQARGFALGWAATVMSPCGVVNCKVLGPPGPLLTNRMSELLTYGSVGGVGRKPGPYPAPNRRHRFPLGTLREFAYLFCAPPASPAAVGEAQRWPRLPMTFLKQLMETRTSK